MSAVSIIPVEGAVSGEVALAGSKSFTNRALVASALAEGKSILSNYSDSDDTDLLIQALRKLGVSITVVDGSLSVEGVGGKLHPYSGELDVGPAGTTMRFLLSLVSCLPQGEVVLCGSKRMHERPIGVLVDALRTLGADITYRGKEGCPPLNVKGVGGLKGGEVHIDASISSQYLTSLLLVGPLLEGGLTLSWSGELVSKSYIEMTLKLLEDFGVKATFSPTSLTVHSDETYQATDYQVEGDASGGSYFWALAAITGGSITVKNISIDSVQGDARFAYELQKMGCQIDVSVPNQITVTGTDKLQPIVTDMEQMPDTAQTLAMVCAFAEGTSTITGLSTLKVKETDRLQALHNELAKLGVVTEITSDSITIHGGTLHGDARIKTYEDHRMAMSFALLGAKLSGVVIEEPDVVRKSFPTYWEKLSSLGVGVR